MKRPVLSLLLLVSFCGSAYAQSSFFFPTFWRSYLVLHMLPVLALILSLLWGKKHSVARVIVYGLCGIAAIFGLLVIFIMLIFNEEGLFPLLTLTALSVGVIVITRKRKEKVMALSNQSDNTGKYKIITGINSEYKINPANPKYFAKFINDDILCIDNTEAEAIDRLKTLYEDYKRKNKLHSLKHDQVLNTYVSTEKFEKYFLISMEFFELINEDPYSQMNDEFTVEDFKLSEAQIGIINSTYGLNIQPADLLVDIFEKINKSRGGQ